MCRVPQCDAPAHSQAPSRAEPGTAPRLPDEELARALISGEPWAARAVWERFAPMVHRLFSHALGSSFDADDATQEVFARFFSRITRLEQPAAIRSFVYSIAVRVLKWQLQRRWIRRILRISEPFSLPEVVGLAPDPLARAAVLRLYECLDRMNVTERTIFVLRNIDGLTLSDVASTLGVSLATVKRRGARASARMRAFSKNDPLLAAYVLDDVPEGT
jgi:RNA polymerase sigma-70 factor (ECF subfamily)